MGVGEAVNLPSVNMALRHLEAPFPRKWFCLHWSMEISDNGHNVMGPASSFLRDYMYLELCSQARHLYWSVATQSETAATVLQLSCSPSGSVLLTVRIVRRYLPLHNRLINRQPLIHVDGCGCPTKCTLITALPASCTSSAPTAKLMPSAVTSLPASRAPALPSAAAGIWYGLRPVVYSP